MLLPDWVVGDPPHWGALGMLGLVLVGAFVAFSLFVFVDTTRATLLSILSILVGGTVVLVVVGAVAVLRYDGPERTTPRIVLEIALIALGGSVAMLVVGGILYVITGMWRK
jgi:hypothetical protein